MGRERPDAVVDDSTIVGVVRDNFRFLTLEVIKQLEDTREALDDPRPEVLKKIAARDDYIDNLKSVIENECFRLITAERLPDRTVDLIRALNVCTGNLERIADFAVNIVGQLKYLDDGDLVERFGPQPFFAVILGTIGEIEEALFRRDMQRALRICRTEWETDQLYAKVFNQIMDELRAGQEPAPLVTALFVYRYLERMGDSLLNIGEAVIFAALGEKLKVEHYQALERTLASSQVDVDISDLDYEGIWASKSGAQIGTLHEHDDPQARWIIFKEGEARKVEEEKEALERWDRLLPGMPPKVFGFHAHGNKASLLMEYLRGETFQHMVLDAEPHALRDAFVLLVETLSAVWVKTRENAKTRPGFLAQLHGRLDDVYKVHPEFQGPVQVRIGKQRAHSFEELLERAREIDDAVLAPFSVLIHGDFNTDNVIINAEPREIHFIDLHRSKMGDYVQDVSVFLVSNFRLPVFELPLRGRIDAINREFIHFAREFAGKHGDPGFDARLALGLTRSLFTSTRFQLDEEFSRAMFLRAVYLLERLVEHQGRPWEEFRLNQDVLVI